MKKRNTMNLQKKESIIMERTETYAPYLFFAPLEEEIIDAKYTERKWNTKETKNSFLFLDLETTGYFQNETIFGGLLEENVFIIGINSKDNKEETEKWLKEIFEEEEILVNKSFYVVPLDGYYDYVYQHKGLIVGANPLFDLSRMITSYETKKVKKPSLIRNGVKIKVKDRGYGDKIEKYIKIRSKKNKDVWMCDAIILNVLQLGSGITGEPKISLDKLCKILNVIPKKMNHPFESIKNNKETLKYMIYDILATKACYIKLYEMYENDIQLVKKVVSSATIGKDILKKCGVKKPSFPIYEDLVKLFEAYYGGRSEVNFRGETEKEYYNLDFLSQYPIINIILDLQRFMLSSEIRSVDRTDDKVLHKKLENIKLNDLRDLTLWKELSGLLVKLEVENIRMPIRIKYGKGINIQLPYVTTDKENGLWWSIFDYVGGKIYNDYENKGKIKIVEIREYVSVRKQKNLCSTSMFGIDITPETMFFDLLRYRMKLKEQKKKAKTEEEKQRLEELIWGVKLILNSTSYGATIERNESTHEKFYSYVNSDNENIKSRKKLKSGAFSCPISGVQITGSARLLMDICEVLELTNNKQRLPYIDTDGGSALSDEDKINFFHKFSPIEGKEYLEYDDLILSLIWGIAPKRYIKFTKEKGIWKKGMRIHGLGTYTSFLSDAEEYIGIKLRITKITPKLNIKLKRNVITKINTNTCSTLAEVQEKCSWIKPYSFGWKTLPDKYVLLSLDGRGVRMFNEKITEPTDKELEDYINCMGLLDHNTVLNQFFEYKAQKYDVKDFGWNTIPQIKLSKRREYISKMGAKGYIGEPESFITDKEKQIEKLKLREEDRELWKKYKWMLGIRNIQKEGLGKNINKRGLSKKIRNKIKKEIKEMEGKSENGKEK